MFHFAPKGAWNILSRPGYKYCAPNGAEFLGHVFLLSSLVLRSGYRVF